MQEAAKLVMPGGGAPDAWGLTIKSILSFTTKSSFLLPTGKATKVGLLDFK